MPIFKLPFVDVEEVVDTLEIVGSTVDGVVRTVEVLSFPAKRMTEKLGLELRFCKHAWGLLSSLLSIM